MKRDVNPRPALSKSPIIQKKAIPLLAFYYAGIYFHYVIFLITLKFSPMKPKNYINTAFVMVALVFGFSSCAYDSELQPPKHTTGVTLPDDNGTGKTAPIVTQPTITPVKAK